MGCHVTKVTVEPDKKNDYKLKHDVQSEPKPVVDQELESKDEETKK